MSQKKCATTLIACIALSCALSIPAYSMLSQEYSGPVIELLDKGDTALNKKDFRSAETLYKSAEAKYNSLPNHDKKHLAEVYKSFFKLYRQEKKFDLAFQWNTKFIALEKEIYGPKSIFIAEDYKALADAQRDAGLLKEAQKTYLDTISMTLPAKAADFMIGCPVSNPPSSAEYRKFAIVSDCYSGLTQMLEKEKDLDGAERIYKQALATSPSIKDMDVYWLRKTMQEQYIAFLDRNDRDSEKAKDELEDIKRLHEVNHEYRRGELPSM